MKIEGRLNADEDDDDVQGSGLSRRPRHFVISAGVVKEKSTFHGSFYGDLNLANVTEQTRFLLYCNE